MKASSQFLGFRGTWLKVAMIGLVVAPSFLLFGYNNGSTGGINTLPSFLKVSKYEFLNAMLSDHQ